MYEIKMHLIEPVDGPKKDEKIVKQSARDSLAEKIRNNTLREKQELNIYLKTEKENKINKKKEYILGKAIKAFCSLAQKYFSINIRHDSLSKEEKDILTNEVFKKALKKVFGFNFCYWGLTVFVEYVVVRISPHVLISYFINFVLSIMAIVVYICFIICEKKFTVREFQFIRGYKHLLKGDIEDEN